MQVPERVFHSGAIEESFKRTFSLTALRVSSHVYFSFLNYFSLGLGQKKKRDTFSHGLLYIRGFRMAETFRTFGGVL